MNKGKLLRLIAVCSACLGLGVFVFSGCKKGGDHTHTWSEYKSDGESGHHRTTTCTGHDPIDEKITPHDSGDSCSKCGYVKGSVSVPATGVEISGDATVKVGGKIMLTATVTPQNATVKTAVWSITSGGEFADIDSTSGQLTGKAKGTVTVKATVGSVSDTYEVEVVDNGGTAVAVTGVTLDKGTLEITVGDADVTLKATVNPDDADDKSCTWKSGDSAVATVSSSGVVHAVAAGSTTVTVKTNDGNHTAECQVTVKAPTPGKDPSKPSDPIENPDDPVISGPVQGGPTITKASAGELETAYVEWTAADNAKWYNVYYSPEGANNWTKIDDPLVRQYSGYFRADAVGLKAGTYDMKVVPVSADDTEATAYAATAEKMAVYAHERSGYAFTESCVPGAYNMDGTLKANTQVVYVTAANAKTVKATVNGTELTGLQAILDGYQKGTKNNPLCIRLIGKVAKDDLDKISSSEEGLQIKGKSIDAPAEHITIEGVGNDGTIHGFGILMRNCKNIEVRNLGVLYCMDDGISIDTDNSHLWIHNNDIFYGAGGSGDKAKGDGALDTKESTLITHSYNHFWDCGKCNLQGMKSEDPDTRITYHHNWYDHSDSRHPRIRTATVHVYNNYFDGNAKYGVGVTTGASAFVENNYFRSTAPMKPMLISLQGTDTKMGTAVADGTFSDETGGIIKAFGNTFDCSSSNLKLVTYQQNSTHFDCYEASSRAEKVPTSVKSLSGGNTYNNFDTADDMYEYTVDTPEQAKTKVERYAGRVDGGDLKWDFNDQTEDPNYAIITELKDKVTHYSGTVVKIGNIAVSSSGGSTGGTTGGGTGGDDPVTPPTPAVEGEISYNPAVDGADGNDVIKVSGNISSSSPAVTIGDITIPAKSALKMETATSITFTTTETMTLTLYVSKARIKVDGNTCTGTSSGDYYVVTVELAKGNHTVAKGDSGLLFLLTLAPKA